MDKLNDNEMAKKTPQQPIGVYDVEQIYSRKVWTDPNQPRLELGDASLNLCIHFWQYMTTIRRGNEAGIAQSVAIFYCQHCLTFEEKALP